ncbi:unnamed protein product [Symbiodinium sp. CCMP2592]|nr:unnamed protein product [Symbiodinium sp. CCMP2592]
MGNCCHDAVVVAQAKIANATERVWMTPRGAWSQVLAAGSLPWAFSSQLDSSDYAKVSGLEGGQNSCTSLLLLRQQILGWSWLWSEAASGEGRNRDQASRYDTV